MAKFNLAELIVKFTGDTSGLDKSISQSEKSVSIFSKNIGKIAAVAGTAAVGLGALAASQANVIDANNDMARSLGISNAALTEMSYVARFSGVDIGQLTSALGLMQRTIGEAAGGAEGAIGSLAKIGLTVQDLINLSPDQQFSLIAEKIGAIQNPAERTAAAMDIFGRSGRALNDVMDKYAQKLQEAKEFTNAFGIAMSELDVQKVTDAKDEWEKLGLVLEGVKNELAVELAPAAQIIGKALTDAARTAARQWQDLKHIINGVFSDIKKRQEQSEDIVRRSRGLSPVDRRTVDPSGGFPYGVIYGSGGPVSSPGGTISASATSESISAPLKVATSSAREFVEVQKDISRENERIANSAGDAFADFIGSIGQGKNALQSLRATALGVLNDIVSNMFRLSFGGTSSGGFAGSIATSILGGIGGLFGARGSFARTSVRGALNPNLFGPGFADGGVVNKTTMFPIGTNTAMMGEAGPEAIMPLTRVGGKLGVQTTGGGGANVTQNLNFSTGINQTVREEVLRLMPQIQMAAVSGVKKAQNRGMF